MSELRDQLQRTLGDAYRLERELGGGGMSRVFVADEVRLDRRVVVKVLSPDLAQGISAERFEREIRTVAGLQQANIVPVLTAGETDGLPFYTMPFVEGESLRAHLQRGALAINDVIGIVKDVSKALSYAHQRGVVHRDIKPDNVLLSGGTAVVTDFGIAKALAAAKRGGRPEGKSPKDPLESALTVMGTSLGTPAYMAPEQAVGDADVDHRADIYALGAMAYELLAGHPVFPNRTTQRMLAAHLAETPRPIAELRADVPATLGDLVMRCLAKDPTERPQSANDVIRALDATTSASGMPTTPTFLGGARAFRTALGVYVVAVAAVALLAKAAIQVIGLPTWVFPGALAVMALGLPVVLWTGYVQRVTRRATSKTPGAMASMAIRVSPHVSWRRTARGGMLAVGGFILLVAAFMAARALGIGPAGSLLAAGRLTGRDPIMLTDFRTTNVDSTLGRVVSDAVRAGLTNSSAFTLLAPASIARTLGQMRREPTTPIDVAVAKEIAQRTGLKAIVDGDVTGVTGGYIVSVRLIRADSGNELASFRETGDGPRGLIDAADRLARALRERAGESLREINATPSLAQATTSSLDALRRYSQAVRANAVGDDRAIGLAREAVALDSTFASGWSLLGGALSNFLGTRSAVDSALTQAYKYRDRLDRNEREQVTGRYFGLGPGRDRTKAIAAYEGILRRGDSTGPALTNLGEQVRTRRQYALAESLNVASSRRNPNLGTTLGNLVELQLNQGKLKEAAATIERLRAVSGPYGLFEEMHLARAMGDTRRLRAIADSAMSSNESQWRQTIGLPTAIELAVREGRLRDFDKFYHQAIVERGTPLPTDEMDQLLVHAIVSGPAQGDLARLEAAIARVAFQNWPMIDRPYLRSVGGLARLGSADKARAIFARYRTEMTDTSIVRQQSAKAHQVLGEIALADGKPAEALKEFRLADIGYDGFPADECAACAWFDIGRAFDAAGKPDSAVVMFERYLSTPYFDKGRLDLDPIRVPALRERLGQLYESLGKTEKAVEQYRDFIELWKNADAELQPRVADARRRLARLTPVEASKP